jgi:transcriptional regulator with XRE-family HTH domain
MPPFADKIGVQRSSLSHLLSGRNKPSLDFILKILDVFPDVDLYWMINGKVVSKK